jgi:hypothetical protein
LDVFLGFSFFIFGTAEEKSTNSITESKREGKKEKEAETVENKMWDLNLNVIGLLGRSMYGEKGPK